MNVIINIFFIFLFLLAIMFFKIVDLEYGNPILNKLVLFSLLFVYQFVILLFASVINKCKINITNILYSCLETSLIGVIGYSLYYDLQTFDTSMILDGTNIFYMTLTITLLLTFINIIKLLFGFVPYSCIHYQQ